MPFSTMITMGWNTFIRNHYTAMLEKNSWTGHQYVVIKLSDLELEFSVEDLSKATKDDKSWFIFIEDPSDLAVIEEKPSN
jgi:hypothetical protein